MSDSVVVGGRRWGTGVTKEIITEYCFRRKSHSRSFKLEGEEFENIERFKYGYSSYDCFDTGTGSTVELADVFVTSALNAQLTQERISAIQEVLGELNNKLPVDRYAVFWKLDVDKAVGLLLPAWDCLMSLHDVDVAITHKILHHKLPKLYPLLDKQTIAALRPKNAWSQIHEELNSCDSAWGSLEEWFVEMLDSNLPSGCSLPENPVALSRLRMHDIVLWWQATTQGSQYKHES